MFKYSDSISFIGVIYMAKVIHFEIPADKPQRAIDFYTNIFDWKIIKWDGPMEYWLATTGKKGEMGIDGAIYKREKGAVTRNTISVPDIDDYMKKVKTAGGKLLSDKMPVSGMGFFCTCQDTEGNEFGIMQTYKNAK
jgi:predicted enzyme related to lactoylglutathione lyase